VKRIKFVGKHWIAPELQVLVSGETSESVYSCSTVQRKQVTRGFIFVFIYIELSQIYKSIFKLNIKDNSHIVQDERKQILCESPLAWRRQDAAWMQLWPFPVSVVENIQNIGIS
jgi:hypothetical protein